jgi:hypothetical protein
VDLSDRLAAEGRGGSAARRIPLINSSGHPPPGVKATRDMMVGFAGCGVSDSTAYLSQGER